ncbi:c-type cytochrome [Thalassospira australica]|uniref:c-type cytochrome n=1 Tax=Thalassospira australica TaxID=1528106 RepID=UPI00384CD54D
MKLPTILLSAGIFLFPIAAHSQQPDGERLFRLRCGGCHALDAGENRTGPSLNDITGKPAARLDGVRYSDALRQSGLIWDSETLDAFLANPRDVVAGTRMTIRVPDPAQRAAIIEFLSTQ